MDEPRHLAVRADVPSLAVRVDVGWHLTPERGGTRVRETVDVSFGSLLARLAARSIVGNAMDEDVLADGLATLGRSVEAEAAGDGVEDDGAKEDA
jgi:hypothetical protein